MENFDLDIQKNEEEQSTLNYPLIIGLIVGLLVIGGGAYWFFSKDDTANPDETEANVSSTPEQSDETSGQMIDSTDYQVEQSATDDGLNNNEETGENTTESATMDDTENSDEAVNSTEDTLDNNTVTDQSNNYIYFIVSGAFKDENNAQNKLQALKDQGYQAVITGPNKVGLYIVAYEGFDNIEDAKQKLNDIREQNPQAWIYKKN